MCYFVATAFTEEDIVQLEHEFVVNWLEDDDRPLYFVASGFTHPDLPVITHSGVNSMNWGLIPSWAKDETTAKKIRVQTLNAQSETIASKPSFRNAVKSNNMGILPVKGFFEWQQHANGIKYPYFIYPAEERFFYFATLFETNLAQNKLNAENTFSILTTVANARMQFIHNTKQRMPVILDAGAAKKWIDPTIPFEEKQLLLQPCDITGMKDHTVSRLITSRKENPNQPAVIDYFSYPELENIQGTLF